MHRALPMCGIVLLWCACSTILADRTGWEVGGIRLEKGPQDVVRVSRRDWAWGRATMHPVISFALQSNRYEYSVRHDSPGQPRVGIEAPTRCNWHESGMMRVLLDGAPFVATSETISMDEGDKGRATLTWEGEAGTLRYDFVLLPSDERLYLRIRLDPKHQPERLEVALICYVSGYNRRNPEHIFHTPVRSITERKTVRLDPTTEPAIFYADRSLDPADGRGAGPCALYVHPEGVTAIETRAGGYGTPTILHCDPSSTELRLAFVEFPDWSNAEALAGWRESLTAAAAALADSETFAVGEELAALRKPLFPCGEVPIIEDEAPNWSAIPFLDGPFYRAGKTQGPLAEQQTRVQVTLDRTGNLHCRMHCREQNMAQVIGFHTGPEIWQDDCAEVFLAGDVTRDGYMQFIVSVSGEHYAWDKDRNEYPDGWAATTQRFAEHWIADLVIPLAVLGVQPDRGTVLRASFCRERRAGASEFSTWTPPRGFHRPEDWGRLVLGTYAEAVAAQGTRLRTELASLRETLGSTPLPARVSDIMAARETLLEQADALGRTGAIAALPFSHWVRAWERSLVESPLKDVMYELKIADLLGRE